MDATEVLTKILPTLEYAEWQARFTFDPLVRREKGTKGTPSALTRRLHQRLR